MMKTNTFRAKTLGTIVAFAIVYFSTLGPTAQTWAKKNLDWISLYNGQETQFSQNDRTRVSQALTAMGIQFQEAGPQGQILVPASQRMLIQDLVAKIFTQSSRVKNHQSR